MCNITWIIITNESIQRIFSDRKVMHVEKGYFTCTYRPREARLTYAVEAPRCCLNAVPVVKTRILRTARSFSYKVWVVNQFSSFLPKKVLYLTWLLSSMTRIDRFSWWYLNKSQMENVKNAKDLRKNIKRMPQYYWFSSKYRLTEWAVNMNLRGLNKCQIKQTHNCCSRIMDQKPL